MARQPTAGRAGRGGGGRGGRAGRFPKRNEASAPRKTGEVGACKDLEGNELPSDQGTKGKMATCFGPPKRNLHCILAPITETTHAKSG
jgi:hypothetical protein